MVLAVMFLIRQFDARLTCTSTALDSFWLSALLAHGVLNLLSFKLVGKPQLGLQIRSKNM